MKFLFYQLIMALSLFVKTNVHGNIKLLDSVLDSGYEAEALMQAHDYDKAAGIFEQLAKEALPNWQHSLVIYNLGTVKLAQNLNEEALHDYQQVFLDAASTPQIIRSLFINQGIALLKQAQNTNAETPSHELVEKMDLLCFKFESI